MASGGYAPSGQVTLSEASADNLLMQIEHHNSDVEAHKGSMVKSRAAELDMLKGIEGFRNTIRDLLSSGDRKNLADIFGGDCFRIARFRAIMNHADFSDMNKNDDRIAETVDACGDLEGVLKDLGFGEVLQKAKQEEDKKAKEDKEMLARLEREREESKLSAEDEKKAKEAMERLAADRKLREEQERKLREERAARKDDEAERARLDALPLFEWKAVKTGDLLPEGAVYAGETRSDLAVYVARDSKTELGKVNLSMEGEGIGQKLSEKVHLIWCQRTGKNDHGEVLVVPSEWDTEWKPIRKGQPLPEGAVLGGKTKRDGNIYVARANVPNGLEPGKLNVDNGTDGNACNIWVHSSRIPVHEGEVLCIKRL